MQPFNSSTVSLSISTYFYFEQSDATGFTVLPHEYKTIFANEMKIPLLTLGLWYTWIPDLKNIKSLQMQKVIWFDGFSKKILSTTDYVEFLMDTKLCLQDMNNLGIPFITRSKAFYFRCSV